MAARPAALRPPSDQSRLLAALVRLAAWTAVAAAWKSPVCSAVEPEKPLPDCTSTQQVPKVVKGLVPETVPRRSRRVTERMVGPSGIAEVSKETTDLYCLFLLSSPTRRALVVVSVALIEPPALEVSVDSSTQPSWAATEVKVVVTGPVTTCGAALSSPLLCAQPVAPVKAAVRVWLPPASVEVLNEALPAPSTVTLEARVAVPSLKVTVPTGTPEPEVTVAVNVTDCPAVEGLGEEVSVVVVTTAPQYWASRLTVAYGQPEFSSR